MVKKKNTFLTTAKLMAALGLATIGTLSVTSNASAAEGVSQTATDEKTQEDQKEYRAKSLPKQTTESNSGDENKGAENTNEVAETSENKSVENTKDTKEKVEAGDKEKPKKKKSKKPKRKPVAEEKIKVEENKTKHSTDGDVEPNSVNEENSTQDENTQEKNPKNDEEKDDFTKMTEKIKEKTAPKEDVDAAKQASEKINDQLAS